MNGPSRDEWRATRREARGGRTVLDCLRRAAGALAVVVIAFCAITAGLALVILLAWTVVGVFQ